MSKQLNANFIAHESPLPFSAILLRVIAAISQKGGAQGFAAMQYCVIFGTVLEEFLSEPTVLRFHKTKRFPVNTNLVNFDAVLRFL